MRAYVSWEQASIPSLDRLDPAKDSLYNGDNGPMQVQVMQVYVYLNIK